MKILSLLIFTLFYNFCFLQESDWVKTDGTITEITVHRSKRTRETAIVKFYIENGEEQFGNFELFRLPFLGSMKTVGDSITINYDRSNPMLLETNIGKLLSKYGMYVLVLLGIIFSLKPFLKPKNN